MSWDIVEGKWKQLLGFAKEKWGKLTDDDLTQISGKRDKLIGKLQEKYGYTIEEASLRADEFATKMNAEKRDTNFKAT